jgi:hypothetical protein
MEKQMKKIYTPDALTALLTDTDSIGVRATSWPKELVGTLVKDSLIISDGDKTAVVSCTNQDLKHLLVPLEDQPMTVPAAKKVFGLRASQLVFFTEEGATVKYRKEKNNSHWLDTNGNEHDFTKPLLLVSEATKAIKAKEQANKQAHLNYVLQSGTGLTFGFELETQKSEGCTNTNYAAGIEKYAAAKITKEIESGKLDTLLKDIKIEDATVQILKLSKDSLFDIKITEPVKKYVLEILTKDTSSLPESFAFPFSLEDVDVTTDVSVSGFEFRTIGGNTASKFDEIAGQLYQLDHDINERCSFHIHVGI